MAAWFWQASLTLIAVIAFLALVLVTVYLASLFRPRHLKTIAGAGPPILYELRAQVQVVGQKLAASLRSDSHRDDQLDVLRQRVEALETAHNELVEAIQWVVERPAHAGGGPEDKD